METSVEIKKIELELCSQAQCKNCRYAIQDIHGKALCDNHNIAVTVKNANELRQDKLKEFLKEKPESIGDYLECPYTSDMGCWGVDDRTSCWKCRDNARCCFFILRECDKQLNKKTCKKLEMPIKEHYTALPSITEFYQKNKTWA